MSMKMTRANPTKYLATAAKNSVLRGAGYLLAAYASTSLLQNTIPGQYHGPVFAAAGIGLDSYLQHDLLSPVLEGAGTFGVVKTAAEFVLKDNKSKFGLAGMEDLAAADIDFKAFAELNKMNGVGASAELVDFKTLNQLAGGDEMDGAEEMDGADEMDGAEEMDETPVAPVQMW